MPVPHQNWQSLGAGGLYGGNTSIGGGGPVSHSELDRLRMGQGRVPTAEYPDGYLGTIRSRQDDRLLDSLVNRETQRSYQRGVHKGERIDPGDYEWPFGLDPQRGVRNQMRQRKGDGVIYTQRQAPKMGLAPAPHLVNDGKANVKADIPAEFSPIAHQLDSLRPTWR